MNKILILEYPEVELSQSYEVGIPYHSHHRELDLGHAIHHILQNSTLSNILRITSSLTTPDFLFPPQRTTLRICWTLPLQTPPSHRLRFYRGTTNFRQNQESRPEPFPPGRVLQGNQVNLGKEKESSPQNHQVGLKTSFRVEGTESQRPENNFVRGGQDSGSPKKNFGRLLCPY